MAAAGHRRVAPASLKARLAMQRREVHYSGRVQGVGFRFTTEAIASRFTVTGFVQNLTDGRVRVVAEGEAAELDQFLAALEERMAHYIHAKTCDVRPATGQYADFSVAPTGP